MPNRRKSNVRPSIDPGHGRCYRCGCDTRHACVSADGIPCHWMSSSLCSHCADNVPAWKPGQKLYQALWFEESVSLIVRQYVLDQSRGFPVIANDLSRAVTRRQELLRDFANTIFDELAVSVLADCLEDDAQATELGPHFALQLSERGRGNWIINEFQIRHWAAERVQR